MIEVCLDTCTSYDIQNIKAVLQCHFNMLKVDIKPGMTVVIKPNLLFKASADSAVITHPNVVAAVGIIVKELGAKVLIAESSGGPYTPKIIKSIFNGCGYTEMAEKYGFELYTNCKSQSVELEKPVICHRLNVIEPFLNADYIINIAKLKSHCMAMFSGAVKNLFGTVPGLMKPELHCRFPNKSDFMQMLVDLCQFIKPNLSIIDSIIAMEGDGPSGGAPRKVGALITSKNPYTADFVGATIANMDPMKVLYLKHAVNRKIFCADEIKIIGDDIKNHIQLNFKQPRSKSIDFIDKLPKLVRPAIKKLATPKPKIIISDCIGCGKCAESCPKNTIEIVDKKAVIKYSKCIHCFCCHEMCPKRAIKIKRFSLFK